MSGAQDSRSRGTRHRLNARGSREIVFCHECDNEWFRDDHGLSCPRCDGQITEIIDPGSDPRPRTGSSTRTSQNPLHDHNPWMTSNDSDPDEVDIDEHINRTPGSYRPTSRGRHGSSEMPRRRSSATTRRQRSAQQDNTATSFQDLLGSLLGPSFRTAQSGRSDQNTLFSGPGWSGRTFQVGGQNGNPRVSGGTWTFSASVGGGPSGTRVVHRHGGTPADPFSMLNEMFGSMGPHAMPGGQHLHGFPPGAPGMHQPMPGLFSSMFGSPHTVNGDAVYTQEALDRIMSQLMEQHPTSNAPGPAPRSDIESLPRRKLNEQMLGPEGKGECSVCMDDVTIGDEVVQLPCTHWFHEQCASAWLSEHNTCPICRKGISEPPTQQEKKSGPSPGMPSDRRSSVSDTRDRGDRHRGNTRGSGVGASERRQAERLAAIRQTARISPPSSRRASLRSHGNDVPSVDPSPRDSSFRTRHRSRASEDGLSPRSRGTGPSSPTPPGAFPHPPRRDDSDEEEGTSRHEKTRPHRGVGERTSADKGKERERTHERYRTRGDTDRDRARAARDEHDFGSTVSSGEGTTQRRSRNDARGSRGEPRRESSGLPSWLRDTFGGSSNSRRGDDARS